ncbi:MAG: hypothetical protein A2X64_02840 [Ignavibacteria bacterium GWF2_33_9]|nr:MAG: hypothetical protein A2X64_02840 [Ignavibacteria bacterium GWF2_33_9]
MWIEVFRTGSHTDSAGKTQEFTAQELDAISAKYSQRLADEPTNLAPFVKGHPKSDDAAIGWVESLARRGNFLLAKIKDLSHDVAEEIKQKKFRNISVSLFSDFSLNHIGLLGAANPAVQGLQTVDFIADYKELTEFAYEKENDTSKVLVDENQQLRSKLEEYESREFSRQIAEYAKSIIATGIISENNEAKLTNALEFFHLVDEQTSNKFNVFEQFKTFISQTQMKANLTEFAVKERAASSFAANKFSDKHTNPERADLHSRILRKMSDNPEWTYEEALLSLEK